MYLDQIQQKKKSKSYETITGLAMSSLPVIGFIIFALIPMVIAIYLAFCSVEKLDISSATWNNFENFSYVLNDKKFWESGVNTIIFTISLPICMVISLGVAFLLTKKIKGKKVFRTIFFIPYVCSVVAVALMWGYIFNPRYGVVNSMLGVNKPDLPTYIDWLGDPNSFRTMIILMSVWGGCGYQIILYTAALTNINPTLYEAAKIDGANAWQCFRHITLPGVSPTTFYLFITGLIGSLQSFAALHAINSTGSNPASLTIGFYLYNYMGFNPGNYQRNMGVASAAALILSVFIVIITVIQFKGSRKWVNYD